MERSDFCTKRKISLDELRNLAFMKMIKILRLHSIHLISSFRNFHLSLLSFNGGPCYYPLVSSFSYVGMQGYHCTGSERMAGMKLTQ
jgi:hypothetical protein